MIQPLGLLRLALARPAGHPISEAVRRAGWGPAYHPCTQFQPTGSPPPRPFSAVEALLALSPAGARAVAAQLPTGLTCLVQGQGTADALGRQDLELLVPDTARAEALWDLLRASFPEGGDFLLVRGERSRGYLEGMAQDTAWSLHPWTTHREAPADPLPPLGDVAAVLALSPLQAEVLAPQAQGLLRFAWGRATAAAFTRVGAPAHSWCEPKVDLLIQMLAHHLNQEESPC